MKHNVHEEFGCFSKEFYAIGPQRLTQMCEKWVDTGGDFVRK
jgi:hypothetical protein